MGGNAGDAMTIPLPVGDRFDDTLKFRMLGAGGGDALYECWGAAISAYVAACVAEERQRCLNEIECGIWVDKTTPEILDSIATAIRGTAS